MFAPSASRPPLKTYGRRSAVGQKRRAPSPEQDKGSDTDAGDTGDNDTPRATTGSTVSMSSAEGVKRSRTVAAAAVPISLLPQENGEREQKLASPSMQRSVSYSSPQAPTTPKRRLGRTKSEFDVSASPRDLSDLFAAVSPGPSASGSTPPRPRAPRRMLSKAQSMTVSQTVAQTASAPSTPRALRTAQSMPITPSSTRSVRTLTDASTPGSPIPQSMVQAVAPASPSPSNANRTYGGSRSFLTRNREVAEEEGLRESYEEQRKRYEVDAGEADPFLAKAPEPIADMRSKGENRRFMGEIGFLIEGIQGSAGGARRSSALDILSNMQDADWMGKLNVSGQSERVFEALLEAGENDVVMQTMALLYLGLMARNHIGVSELLQVQAEAAVRLLEQHVDVRDGPLDSEYKSKPTPIILALRRICNRLLKGSSTRALASYATSCCTRTKLLPLVAAHMLQERMDLAALSALTAEARPLVARTDLYSKGLDLLPQDADVDLRHIQQCLETTSSLFADAERDREDMARHFDDMMGLFVIFMAAGTNMEENQGQQCLDIAMLSLQPLVALASAARTSTRLPESAAMLGRLMITRDRVIKAVRDRPVQNGQPQVLAVDDIMSFALAILLSMINASSALQIATTRVSGCSTRECIYGCRCPSAEPLVGILAKLYSDEAAARGDNELTQIYLHGYLAYIIARLLVSADEVRGLVEHLLPGGDWREKVEQLGEALIELKSLNAAAGQGDTAGETEALLEEAIEGLRQLQT